MTRHAQRGQALGEFALAASALLVLLFGILDFGRALFAYNSLANGARLGTRFAEVRGTTCVFATCPTDNPTIQTYVQNVTPNLAGLTTTTVWGPGYGCPTAPYKAAGCTVTVTATYRFGFVVFFYLPAALKTLSMSSTSTMVISR